jgi:predicted Zn-ribbon and HTH transcriptional regulator
LDEVVFEDDTDLDPVPFDDEPYDPYKHVSVDDMTFTEQDKTIFEKDSTPLFHSGEIDEDGIKRYDNSIRKYDFEAAKKEMIKKSIKCDGCGSTFFVENPEIPNSCPSCEKEYKGITYTIADYLKEKRSKEGASTKL